MSDVDYSEEFVAWLKGLSLSKRAAQARDILLERGTVTTAELNRLGYDHPPRAIGDLKDAGVTVVTEMVQIEGRRMAQYTLIDTFGSNEKIRRQLPKKFRDGLYRQFDYRCAICGGEYSSRELQTDHRIPFRIAGDPEDLDTRYFMPLCGSDNRAKSWTCERCTNWKMKDPAMCEQCYWANPEEYSHIAGVEERRLAFVVRGDEVKTFDRLVEAARDAGKTPGEWVAINLSRITDESDS